MSEPHALVERVVNAFIPFAQPMIHRMSVSSNDIHGSIGGAAVDDQIFNVLRGLGDHALDRRFHRIFIVEDDGYDRYQGNARFLVTIAAHRPSGYRDHLRSPE